MFSLFSRPLLMRIAGGSERAPALSENQLWHQVTTPISYGCAELVCWLLTHAIPTDRLRVRSERWRLKYLRIPYTKTLLAQSLLRLTLSPRTSRTGAMAEV